MTSPVRYGPKTGRNFSNEFSSETKFFTYGNHEPLYLSIESDPLVTAFEVSRSGLCIGVSVCDVIYATNLVQRELVLSIFGRV